MGWTGTTRTRPWTGTPRACGAPTSSRASRRPSPSTLPAAGGKSSCQTRGRCMVSALDNSQGDRRTTITWKWMHKNEKTIHSSEIFVAKRQQTPTVVPRTETRGILFPPLVLVSQLWHRGECFLSTQSSLEQVCTCCTVTQGQVLPVAPTLSELVIVASRASRLPSPWFTPVCSFRAFTAYFSAHCFSRRPLFLTALSVAKPACWFFVFFYRRTSCSRCLFPPPHTHTHTHTPVLLGEFCLQVTGRRWFLVKCFRLMPACPVKWAIISPAWNGDSGTKTSHWHAEDLNIHMVSE